ncbi:uncharacterized protein A1O5_09406 [Cladophialophora psammophila CBS 110553]|uniref:Uncharacterized protein n=1 Tax=Cladophialophora psammophila CBS 110553 TaxID=1182543 RepID=W9WHM5_9EURO|nr:uncharacterized protein A1O5_09406 [Cladophialophora psammophila CBS 110553]EXJ67393.1 hypothetical protein A1O5_09406 [Cladophialophora psammophila CBS 110553]
MWLDSYSYHVAGSGIGLFTARRLHKDGWEVSIADINEKAGQVAAEEVDGIFTKVDITKYESLVQVFEKTWKKWQRIDFVFSNAGILDVADFYAKQETLPPPEPSLATSKVSVDGYIYTSYLALHYFRQNPNPGSTLILTSSASALYESPILPLYCAAKYAVVGLARSLGKGLQEEKIRVNTILPGAVPTNIGLPPKLKQLGITPTMPEDKLTTPDNIVDAVYELLNDQEAYGVVMEVSGPNRYRRPKHDYPDATMAFVMGEKDAWDKA